MVQPDLPTTIRPILSSAGGVSTRVQAERGERWTLPARQAL